MLLKIVVYIFFYISVFLLGFFGLAPIFLLNSMEEKIPYIILVVIGFPLLIGLMVLSYKKGFIKSKYNKGNKEKSEGIEDIQEVEEEVKVIDEDKLEAMKEEEDKVKVIDEGEGGEEENTNTMEGSLNKDTELLEEDKVWEGENT